MRSLFIGSGLAAVLLWTTACQHLPSPTGPSPRDLADARRRVENAYAALAQGRVDDAEAAVAPLAGKGLRDVEVAQIQQEIARRRAADAAYIPERISSGRVLQEVEERLRLPENYGRTVVISPAGGPLELPPGPMEQLVNRKVTMDLDKAPVSMILMALNQIDGLSLIADQALTEGAADGPALSVHVKDVPLRDVLGYIARNMGIAFHLGENVIWVTAADTPAGSGPQMETRFYRLRRGFVPAAGGEADDDLQNALDAFMTQSPQGAAYRIFKNRNLLVVRDTRENQRHIEAFIRELDREPLQVLIEARFVTISHKGVRELGTTVQKLRNESSDDSIVKVFDASNNLFTQNAAAATTYMSLTGILGSFEYDILVAALEETDETQTLSAPRLTVLNNRTATIHKGSDFYYWEEWETSTTTVTVNDTTYQNTTPQPSGAPTKEETGVKLEVSPSIGNDGRTVILSLKPEITQFEKFYTYGTSSDPDPDQPEDGGSQETSERGYQLPSFLKSSLDTTVTVASGDTVVLGGTLETTEQVTIKKTPWLGDLPLVGWLFKHRSVSNEPRHLLIFVTATIIDKSGRIAETDVTP